MDSVNANGASLTPPRPGSDPARLRRLMDVELLPFTAGCRCFETGIGRIVVHPGLPVLYDTNLVILRRLPTGKPDEIIKRLEERVRPAFQAVGATHLRFVAASDLTAPVKARFLEAGYRYTDLSIMEHRARPVRTPDERIRVRPVRSHRDETELNLVDSEVLAEVPWGTALIRAALRIRRKEVSEFLDFAWYIAELDGETAGSIGLLRSGAAASIQEVSTRPAFRGRSVATTMVLRMVTIARESGGEVVSLMTEAGSLAEGLYSKLGFEVVGHADSFVRDE